MKRSRSYYVNSKNVLSYTLDKWVWTCEICADLQDAFELGSMAGHALVLQNGKYKLLGGQGHGDDFNFVFLRKPLVPENKDKKYLIEWFKNTKESKRKIPSGFKGDGLLQGARRTGYTKRSGPLILWLMIKADILVRNFEARYKVIKPSKVVDEFKIVWEKYMKYGDSTVDYMKELSPISIQAKQIDPLLVCKYMKKVMQKWENDLKEKQK